LGGGYQQVVFSKATIWMVLQAGMAGTFKKPTAHTEKGDTHKQLDTRSHGMFGSGVRKWNKRQRNWIDGHIQSLALATNRVCHFCTHSAMHLHLLLLLTPSAHTNKHMDMVQ